MTKKEILEGNKLIAEFLGYAYLPYTAGHFGGTHGWVLKNYKLIDKKMPKLFLGRTTKDLLYHKSWDWLMPVVEKIETITQFPISIGGNVKIQSCNNYYYINVSYNSDGYTVSRYLDTDFDYTPLYTKHIQVSKIDAVWIAVVEFIKWYNEKCPE